MKRLNIIGNTYGKLLVIGEAEPLKCGNRNVLRVLVRCECGNETTVHSNSLRQGKTLSCGCLRKQVTGDRARTHGDSGKRLYVIWKSMRSRCSNTKSVDYRYYGGRGVCVCTEWDKYVDFKALGHVGRY